MAELLAFPSQAPIPDAIPDAAARAQALDIRRSFIVEAPAGSGKTGLLIQRYLKLLASDSVSDPAQVLAITFTRKATHEMRDRVLAQLAAAAADTPATSEFDQTTRTHALAALTRDRQLGWNLLSHPDRLNISTIDSLCAQIARALPLLSGAATQSPVEDASDLYAQAARATFALLGGPDPQLHAALELLLLHRDANLVECENLIAAMLKSREQWANLIPLNPNELTDEFLETLTLPRIEKALEQAICRALSRLARLIPTHLAHDLASLARRASVSEGYQGAESPIALCHDLQAAPTPDTHHLPYWRALAHLALAPSTGSFRKPAGITPKNLKFDISKPHKLELCELIEALAAIPGLREALNALAKLPPLRYPTEQWVVAKALFRILARALVELQLVFADRGQSDFTQFSILARAALQSNSALDDFNAAIGFSLQHLLVDEMQDTSNSQYDLIRLLTQHWDGHSQTVFLVGDPKQSIYLFRQARVERFLQTLTTRRLGDLPLTPLHLTANFRSQAHLVHSFNETFAAIFPPAAPTDQFVPHPRAATMGSTGTDSSTIRYLPAHATRPPTYGSDLLWHPTPLPYDTTIPKADLHRAQIEQNAAEIVEIVSTWRARPLPPGRTRPWQIAVLVRNRRHLLEVVRAFSEHEIPYKAVKTEPLAERQEVLDLLALTRAILHPADRTAWLAVLRSPCCGLTLADLHLLTGADDLASNERTILDLIASRGDLLSEDGVERIRPFWTIMTAALAQRASLPLAQLVERTWRAFGATACATPTELANIQQFLALLDSIPDSIPATTPAALDSAAAEPLTIARLTRMIDGLFAASSTAPDAVELMTIHNAKGLERDVILVPQLESSSGINPNRLLSWLEIEDAEDPSADPNVAHAIIAPVQSRGQETQALNQWMRSIESAREAEERKRLFYVACTRASEELHLFAAPARNARGELTTRYDSLLRAAWPAAEPIFANLPEKTEQAQSEQAQPEDAEPAILDLAAAALTLVPPPQPRTLLRIPYQLLQVTSHSQQNGPVIQSLPKGLDSEAWAGSPQTHPHPHPRPTRNLAARAFGTTLHTLLETLTHHLATGTTPATLTAELPTWTPRITALLTSLGTPTPDRPAATAAILHTLTRNLADPVALWLLAAHPESRTEHSLATSTGQIRLDRAFLAGPTPLSTGQTHLWIIDYKTSSPPANTDPATFLAQQKEIYAPQLATYANHLTPRNLPIHLALYHPTLTTLTWWPHTHP